MNQPLIELRQVSKYYDADSKKQLILDDVNLTIAPGRLVTILGPSGAGKSTLLNLIAGLDTPSRGKVLIGGRDISCCSSRQLADFRAQNIGFVFQFYNILPTLTVGENIELVDALPTNSSELSVAQVLKQVGLERHQHKFPSQLSGGEQQRVSIARAIYKQSKLLLCDEPTGALDSKTGVAILKLLKQQVTPERSVVIVTHNSLIADIADQVIQLKNGQIAANTINRRPKQIDEVIW